MIYRLDCTEKSNKCKCSMRKSRAVRPALFCKGNIWGLWLVICNQSRNFSFVSCFQIAFSIIESDKQPICNRPTIGQKRNDHERNLDFHCSSSAPAIFITPMQHTRTPPVSHSEAKPASVPAAAGIRWAAFGAAFRPAQASLSAWRAKASASGTGLSAGCDCHYR